MDLHIGPHTIRVEVAEPALAQALQEVAVHLGLVTNTDDARRSRGAFFRIVAGPVPPCPPAAREAAPYGEHLRVWREARGIRGWSAHAALVAVPDDGHAEGVVDLVQAAPDEVVALFVLGVFLLLRPLGLFPLHAAVLARDGRGVIFSAPSDAGKSTLAYALVRQGWSFLSDDSVLLHPTDEAVEALAFRRSFRLDPDAQEHFPELAAHWRGQFAADEKGAIPIAALYPMQAVDRCTPGLLVFPEIADCPISSLAPVAKREAFLLLAAQSALIHLGPCWTSVHFDVLRRLVCQAPAYRLRSGRDLLGASGRIVELLEQTAPFARASPLS